MTGPLERLEDALTRVLFDATAREAFLRAEVGLGLTAEEAGWLRGVPHGDLRELAGEIRRRLPARAARGVGRLRAVFADALAGHDEEALFDAFVAHPSFRAWVEIPFVGEGPCLEDVFWRFLDEQPVDRAVARRCLLSALARALAVDPDPAFVVPAPFQGAPGRWVAVEDGVLYAAVRGQALVGGVTPVLAGLLAGDPVHVVAGEQQAPEATVEAARQALVARGLLAG